MIVSIRVIIDLEASPDTATLPADIDLHQVLASDQPAETVTVEYSLSNGNVCFADGSRSKTFSGLQVFQTSTAIDHSVTLVQCAGPATDQVEIDQVITAADGTQTHDLTHVTTA